jgi:hypothetical protein
MFCFFLAYIQEARRLQLCHTVTRSPAAAKRRMVTRNPKLVINNQSECPVYPHHPPELHIIFFCVWQPVHEQWKITSNGKRFNVVQFPPPHEAERGANPRVGHNIAHHVGGAGSIGVDYTGISKKIGLQPQRTILSAPETK